MLILHIHGYTAGLRKHFRLKPEPIIKTITENNFMDLIKEVYVKYEVTGEIRGGHIYKQLNGQGFIYKNYNRFLSKSKNVCYVPELSDKSYRYKDFVEIAMEFIVNNDLNNYNPEELAFEIFDTIDWQHPETLISDWEIDDIFAEN